MTFLKTHRAEVMLFALALVVRLIFLSLDLSAAHGDLIATVRGTDGYFEISQNLVAGHGFSADTAPPYVPNTLRTPGYLYFLAGILAATGGSYVFLTIVQLLLGATIPLLARRVVLALIDAPLVAFATGIALVFEPNFITASFVFATETLFMALFFGFLLFFLAYLRRPTLPMLAASAFLLGLATLTKPTTEYLPLLLTAFIVYVCWGQGTRRIIAHVALFGVLILATLTPWLYRNYDTFGVAGMSSQPAYNLYVYLVPSVLSLERSEPFNAEFMTFSTLAERSGDGINLSNSATYRKEAIGLLERHPKGDAFSAGITFVSFFIQDGMLPFLQRAGYGTGQYLARPALTLLFTHPGQLVLAIGKYAMSPLALVLIFRLLWVLLTLMFFGGGIWYVRRNGPTPQTVLALALVAYFLFTSVVGGLGVTARYRMPVDPIILAFAFLGLLAFKNAIVGRIGPAA